MPAILLDTSVYITVLRQGDPSLLDRRHFAPGSVLWLSAVVLEELYAGARPDGRRELERLEDRFAQIERLVVPNLSDWTQAGKVLSQLGARYGFEHIGRGRLTNDTLIAMSAARLGLTLLTANARDFARLTEFRPFRWKQISV